MSGLLLRRVRPGVSMTVCLLAVLSRGHAQIAAGDPVVLATGGMDGTSAGVISDDGRYLAFVAAIDGRIGGDANGFSDVAVLDRETGAVELVSVGAAGRQTDGGSYSPSISADGRYIVFVSEARNLGGPAAPSRRVFVHDRHARRTRFVAEGDAAEVSADGQSVAYTAGGPGGSTVMVRDLASGNPEVISVAPDGTPARGYAASISGDGRYVAFLSADERLTGAERTGRPDVFVRDRDRSETIRINVSSSGRLDDGYSSSPGISRDGQHIAFVSSGTTLVADDRNNLTDVFVHHLVTATTVRVSVPSAGGEATGSSFRSFISGDGRFVAFESEDANLDGQLGSYEGLYVHDLDRRTTARVNVPRVKPPFYPYGSITGISGTGRFVVFQTPSALTADDTDSEFDIYLGDRSPAAVSPAIASLRNEVGQFDDALQVGLGALDAAAAAAATENGAAACAALEQFENDLQKQWAKAVNGASARRLFTEAERLRELLGCARISGRLFRLVRSSMPLPHRSFSYLSRPQIGDIDGDGIPDAVLAFSGATSGWFVLLGDGFGAFPRRVPMPVPLDWIDQAIVADLNADGRKDIVISHREPARITVTLSGGRPGLPTFATTELPLPAAYNPMDVADVTGDGVLDIVTVSPNESVLRVFAGRGNGSFTAARTTGIGFDAYEVKATAGRDGVYGDVLVGRYYSLALVPGTVNGHLEGYRPVLEGDNFSDFAAADLNRDGRLDVIAEGTQAEPRTRRVLLNVGGGFVETTTIRSGDYSTVDVGDYDADGRLDLAVADYRAQSLVLHRGMGDGTFGWNETITAGAIVGTVTADVNRDGTDDLVSVRSTGPEIDAVLRPRSLSVFLNQPRVLIESLNTPERLAVGTTRQIRWRHALPSTTRFRVDVSWNTGSSWHVLQTDVATRGGNGAVTWTVTGPATETGLIRVVALTQAGETDVTNSYFTVGQPFLQLASVGGGQEWGIGSERRITWTHNLSTLERVDIDISRDDGSSWMPLAEGVALRGTQSSAFTWRVTGPPTAFARLRVRRGSDPLVTSVSPRFAIAPPMLRLMYPVPGGTIYGCSSFTAKWQHNLGTLERVFLELSEDGGQTWGQLWDLRNPGLSHGSLTFYEFVRPANDAVFFRVRWERDVSVQAMSGPLRITAVPDYPYCD